jgi:hypothetical protein
VEYLGDFSRRSFRKQQTQNLKFARRQDFDEEFHWRFGAKPGPTVPAQLKAIMR